MPTTREILLSTYRSGRMKKVRVFVYITQTVLVVLILIILTILTPEAGIDPLYLPFETYFFIIATMLLIVNAESFFFKFFGIRWAKSDSEKFLSAKDYTRMSIAIIIVAVVVMALINIMTPSMDENIDKTTKANVYGVYNHEFTSQDSFAITGVKSITLTSDDNIPLDVFILHKDDYENEIYEKRLNLDEEQSRDITELHYEREGFLRYDDYVLHIDAEGRDATVTYTLERGVSPAFVLYLTIFPIIFAAMNTVWIIYLWPLKKRYEKTSIYE